VKVHGRIRYKKVFPGPEEAAGEKILHESIIKSIYNSLTSQAWATSHGPVCQRS
jgi:hypothetical protein